MEEIEFKTGQEVLVRDTNEDYWCYALYSHYLGSNTNYPHITAGQRGFQFCINYKGNEHLVGTTKPYIADIKIENEDLPINTPVMVSDSELGPWTLSFYAGNNNIYAEYKNSRTYKYKISGYKYIVPVKDFDFNHPRNSVKNNIIKNK